MSSPQNLVQQLRQKLSDYYNSSSPDLPITIEVPITTLNALVQGLRSRKDDLLQVYVDLLFGIQCSNRQNNTYDDTIDEEELRSSQANLCIVDVWLLFCLPPLLSTSFSNSAIVDKKATQSFESQIKKLLRGLIVNQKLSFNLLHDSIVGHGHLIADYLDNFLYFSSFCVETTYPPEMSQCGVWIYSLLFYEFYRLEHASCTYNSSKFHQQEIVARLISQHCLSDNPLEVDVALSILQNLDGFIRAHIMVVLQKQNQKKRKKRNLPHPLLSFLLHLKQLLDFIDFFSISQVRKIYHTFFQITTKPDKAQSRKYAIKRKKKRLEEDDENINADDSDDNDDDDPDLSNAVRKQLYHPELKFRCIGIVGNVARVMEKVDANYHPSLLRKGADFTLDESSDLDGDVDSDDNDENDLRIQYKWEREIIGWLRDLIKACDRHPDALLFLYTELINAIRVDKKDCFPVTISHYISNILSIRLVDQFMLTKFKFDNMDKIVLPQKDYVMEAWMNLDGQDCDDVVNLTNLIVDDQRRANLKYLTPLLSLVAECELQVNQDLSNVSKLLGCPLVMMERNVVSQEEFSELNPSTQEEIMLTLWHGINWCRELLNSFCMQPLDDFRSKIIDRLENVVELESLMENCCLMNQRFLPPLSTLNKSQRKAFDAIVVRQNSEDKLTVPKKIVSSTTTKQHTKEQQKHFQAIKTSYRKLKPQVVCILAYPLVNIARPDEQEEDPQLFSKSIVLSPTCVFFLIELMHDRLKQVCFPPKTASNSVFHHIFHSKKTSTSFTASSNGNCGSSSPSTFMMDVEEKYFGEINDLSSIALYSFKPFQCVKTQIDLIVSKLLDEEQSVDEDVKDKWNAIFILYLKSIIILSTSLELDQMNIEKLNMENKASIDVNLRHKSLAALILGPISDNSNTVSLENPVKLYVHCFNELYEMCDVVSCLDIATPYVEALNSLCKLSSSVSGHQCYKQKLYFAASEAIESRISCQLSRLTHTYLQRNWPSDKKRISYLLEVYLTNVTLPLDAIQLLVTEGFYSFLSSITEPTDEIWITYPTLTRKTIGIFHRLCLEKIVSCISRLDFRKNVNNSSFLLHYLTQAVLLFKVLVNLTKSFHRVMFISSVLKYGKLFVEAILRAMPFFEVQFCHSSTEILALLGNLQLATRRMQTLCAHGKGIKDTTITNQVPQVKKTLEKLIYRSQQLVRKNGVSDAFSTGVLRNRSIDGKLIASQQSQPEEEEQEEEQVAEENQTEDENTNEEDNGEN